MPNIEVKIDQSAQDVAFYGFRSGTTGTFPTNVSGYEVQGSMEIGGLDSSAGLREDKIGLIFENVVIPMGSKVESAEITVFAKVQTAQFGNPPMQINISAHTDTQTGAQDQKSYTSVFTAPVRTEKGTFTLTAGETSFVEKVCDVTELVQELVTQFPFNGTDLGNGEMRFRMTNKSFTETQQANPYPRTGGGGSSTQIRAQIYSIEQGPTRSAKLTVVYSNPCTETLCDDFSYRLRSFQDRKLNDPSAFATQISADANYPSSDPARIRINAPFPVTANRLDLSCPAGIPHNASGTGEDTGGIFGGGNIVSNLQWNYRFKIDITSFVINTDPTGQSIHIGLGDSDNTATSDLPQDYIGFKISTAGSAGSFQLVGANGIGPDTGGAIEGTFTTPVTTGVFFVELAREGNSGGLSNISCSLFRDKDYSDLIEKVSGVTPTGIAGLNRLKFMVKNIDGTGNGLIVVEYGQLVLSPTQADRDTFGEVELKAGFDAPTFQALGHAVAREPSKELRTFEDDFTAPTSFADDFNNDTWNDVGAGFGVNLGTEENDWSANIATSNNATEINFNNTDSVISNTDWTLRFKLDIDALTNGTNVVENHVFFGLGNASSVSNPPTVNQISMGLMASINDTIVEFRTTWSSSGQPLFSNQTAFTTAVPSVGTVYVEIKRVSTTSLTVNIYSDEAFKTLIESVTDSGVPAVTGLSFIKMSSRSDGTGADSTLNGSIDDLQFFGSISSVPSNWTETGTNVVENLTTESIDVDSTKDGTLHQTATDLLSTSDNKWTLRFNCEILTSDVPTTNDCAILVNISDSDQTVGVLSAQDTITFEYNSQGNTGAKRIVIRASDGVGILPGSVSSLFFTSGVNDVGDGRFYVEVKRLSLTLAEINIYSDSDFTNLVITSGQLTIPATIDGLRFIRVSSRDDVTSAGILTSRIDNIQFWNGQEELEKDNNWRVSN